MSYLIMFLISQAQSSFLSNSHIVYKMVHMKHHFRVFDTTILLHDLMGCHQDSSASVLVQDVEEGFLGVAWRRLHGVRFPCC